MESGGVWLNGKAVVKPSQAIKIHDQLAFPTGPRHRQVVVMALGNRRGPAPEAQALYRDLTEDGLPPTLSVGLMQEDPGQ